MEISKTALDLDAFQQWRRSCFYPKADLPLPDAVLRGECDRIDDQGIADACSQALGESVTVAALEKLGTFHRLWRVQRQEGKRLICRANVMSRWLRDYPLGVEARIGPRLLSESLPIVCSHAVDVSRAHCPFDFALMDEAKGVPLAAFDDNEAVTQQLLHKLGRVLARLHRIEFDRGYGLLDVEALDGGRCVGSHNKWQDYLLVKLDDHIQTCLASRAVTEWEARRIRKLFAQNAFFKPRRSLLHGDPGSGNVFVSKGEISALIDWEDALVGDPVYEIAFWATFHPERRHQSFLDGYRQETDLPSDFEPRFWLYYLRVALAKTVLRRRLGLIDKPGRQPASDRIRRGLRRLEAATAVY